MSLLRKKIFWVIAIGLVLYNTMICYAETTDAEMPIPYNIVLSPDGDVTWAIENENPSTGRKYVYKKFQVQLRKRFYDVGTGGSYNYYFKDYGSTKTVSLSASEGDEYLISMDISSPGMYIAKVRAVSAENTYSKWGTQSEADAIGFDSNTTNISIHDGSSVASNYGPGTVYSGSGAQVANPFVTNKNYGGASNIIGSNGQYITSNGNGAAYVYDNTYQNNIAYQGQSSANIGVGPGMRNGATEDTFAPGPGTNAQVVTGNNNYYVTSPNYTGITNTNQIVQSGPSQSGNSQGAYAQQNWSTEVGWHYDANGFYYYQGNGVYLRNQWYLINNYYYRFDANAYALISKWFKDPTNNAWYYLGAEGKMLTGWQYISGIWYYLNPERGTNYGVMFSNCSVNIGGKYYAFNSEGGCILNGYFNGSYYGADGSRQY